MNRTRLLAALGAVALASGVTAAAARPAGRPTPVLAVGSSPTDETPTTTGAEDDTPSTTTTVAPATTTTTMTASESEPPPASAPTTTTEPRPSPPLGLRCAGAERATAARGGHAWVLCELKGVDERAAHLTLTRDGETIARTDDTSTTTFKDPDVEAGRTYTYQAHTFASDGALLQSSNPVEVTVTPARDSEDRPLVLRCAGSPPPERQPSTMDAPDGAWVDCAWKGVPPRTAVVVLTRDGQPIARINPPTTTYQDRDVWVGRTYLYQVHAHAADGTLLASSEPSPATPGTAGEGA